MAGIARGLAVSCLVGFAAITGVGARQNAQFGPVFQDLWLYETGKSALTRLTTASEPGRVSSGASITADGRRIVFHSDSDFLKEGAPRGIPEVWLYDIPARQFTRITTTEPTRRSSFPSISADGSTVVFESDADLLKEGLPRGQVEIWRYAVATGALTRITRATAGGRSGIPVVDATGAAIAFHSLASFDGAPAPKTAAIWLFDTKSGAFTRVTADAAVSGLSNRGAAISANGRRVAFMGDGDVWLYDVPTKAITRLTMPGPSRASESPSLSADGNRVVFHSDADLLKEERPDSVDEIWMYDVAAKSLKRLTSTWVPARDAGTNAVLHPDCQYPRITADGRAVVFAADADFLGEKTVVRNGFPHAWIMDIETGRFTRIDTSAGSGSGVAINADATRVVLFRTDFDLVRASRHAPGSEASRAAYLPAPPPPPPGPARPTRLTADDVAKDLAAFRAEVEGRWAYLRTNGVNYRAALDAIQARAKDGIGIDEYGVEVQKFISMFIDGHSSVSGYSLPPGSLPFFIEPTDGKYVAIKGDRSGFFEPEHPFVTKIDGRPIADLISVLRPYASQGSPQYRQNRALRMIGRVQWVRQIMGLPTPATVRVELAAADPARTRVVEIPVAAQGAAGSAWPRTQSRVLDGNIGYLRIPNMDEAAGNGVHVWMPKFRDTRGLIVDVRGNGGGTRDALRALFPYVMAANAPPIVVNAAKYRLHPAYAADHLGGSRFMWVESYAEWTAPERQAIAQFKKTFKPEWEPPAAEFSDWHYLVMSRTMAPQAFAYGKPVIILLDEKCFSATDIFLSAFKGYPGVTLVGYASGGGSARQVGISLPISRMSMTLASMASFQRDGQLYDARGIHPDVVVHPDPRYYLVGGPDNVLEAAMKMIK